MIRRFCLLILALLPLALTVAPAQADDSSSLTVIGTSDVSDSGLMQNVIQPAFNAAYPQYTFKYIGTGTGAAITSAESGSQGASVLIVHAASLENQFVAGGYSLERYGRAIFTNDFVLAGPQRDPAGVGTAAAHDIARAFAAVAAAGARGRAEFVSRGGTPGTTVKEHAIWKLVDSAGIVPPGVLLCAVGAKLGGGETPIAPGNGVTASGQPCPDGGTAPTGSALPAWYSTTGLTQGPNVVAANACNGYPSGPGSCYVLTDRGTFDYLASGTDPAGSIPGLKILTRDNAAAAPGGASTLINYFHAYAINPHQPGESVNVQAAERFLALLTSSSLQASIARYLARTSDPGGAPFKPDAAPVIKLASFPSSDVGGAALTVAGSLINPEPGYPALAHQPVAVVELEGGLPVPVTGTRTDAHGMFTLRFRPAASGVYQLVTPQLAQIEDATLQPSFGDLLSPAASAARSVRVSAVVRVTRLVARGDRVVVAGRLSPRAPDAQARVYLMGRRRGSRHAFRRLAVERLAAGQDRFLLVARLPAGRWQIRARYSDPGELQTGSSAPAGIVVARRGRRRPVRGRST